MFEDFLYKRFGTSTVLSATGTTFNVAPQCCNRGSFIFSGIDSASTSYGRFTAVVFTPTGATFALAPFKNVIEPTSPLNVFLQGKWNGQTGQGIVPNQRCWYFPLRIHSISNTENPPSGTNSIFPTFIPTV